MSTFSGQEYQHALIDLQLNIPGAAPIKSVTFSKLSGKPSAEKKPVLDSQGNITNYTIDNKKIDTSITWRLSEYRRIRDQMVRYGLQQVPQLGPLQIAMDWTITVGNSPQNYFTDVWQGIMFNDDPLDSSSDQAALEVEMGLFAIDVKPNGQSSIIYRPY